MTDPCKITLTVEKFEIEITGFSENPTVEVCLTFGGFKPIKKQVSWELASLLKSKLRKGSTIVAEIVGTSAVNGATSLCLSHDESVAVKSFVIDANTVVRSN